MGEYTEAEIKDMTNRLWVAPDSLTTDELQHLTSRLRPAPTPLAWSTESPVKPGNYLVRGQGDTNPRGWWLEHWEAFETPGEGSADMEYAGPISEPVEPTP